MARPKGVPNRRSVNAVIIARDLGVDPFEVLCHFMKRDWKKLGYKSETKLIPTKDGVIEVDVITPEMQLSAAMQAVKFIYPQRSAIAVTEEPEKPKAKEIYEAEFRELPKKDT